MKKSMIAIALLLTGVAGLQAVGDLQISLQGTNVVLSWASTNSDYYLVQYSTNLHSSHPWQTLTNWMPGSDGTNTVFVHSGAFHVPTVSPDSLGYNDLLSAQTLNQEEVPLAMRANDPDSAAPVFLYPPGFDFSGFLLYDPVTQTWHSGNGFTRDNPPNPLNPGTNMPTSIPFEMKFYKVVQHGIQCLGITNGMTLSGVVTIPIEVGIEDGELTTICMRENGVPVGESIEVEPFSSPLQIILDTTTMSNGVHEISAFASWLPTIGSGDGGDVESIPVDVNIFNPISFPNWMDYFGQYANSITFNVQSAFTNIWYFVDIYDSNMDYIGTFENYSSDGNIHQTWNLIGPGPEFYSYFNEPCIYSQIGIIPLLNRENMFRFKENNINSLKRKSEVLLRDSAYLGPVKRSYRHPDHWTTNGMWVIAYQDAWQRCVGEDSLTNAVNSVVLLPESKGLTVRPETESGAFHIIYSDDDFANQTSSWGRVREALFNSESRNFFYLGHGNPNGIGRGNTNSFISAQEIANRLHTVSKDDPARHSYRFVFLYGCETSSGNLSQSFGIDQRENIPLSEFNDAALTPCAFVGWSDKQSAAIATCVQEYHPYFIQGFVAEWLDGYGLKDAIIRGKNNHPRTSGINLGSLKIFGYSGLRRNDYNMYYGD
ncbi:MAG: hypothetical protein IJU47_01880 [Verrucomicrobia bacterium]|nr:hypothetical protein [Verrucomicrobiota bacterium]